MDQGPLGTTCARIGCMPSKVLIQIANDYHYINNFKKMGILGSSKLKIDGEQVLKHVRKLRNSFVRGVKKGIDEWRNKHLIIGTARFIDQNTIEVNEKKITAQKFIIATGSTPVVPDEWREYKDFVITTDKVFELKTIPKSLAVIGLGAIGLELGQAMSRLGAETVGISQSEKIGGITDPEILKEAQKIIKKELKCDYSGVKSVKKIGKKLVIKTRKNSYKVDKALVCVGRKPNLSSLNLECLNIDLDAKSVPIFDNNTCQVGNTNIFICGDADNERAILHEAADDGAIAGHNAMLDSLDSFKRKVPFSMIFTEPNIAFIGKRFRELKGEKKKFKIGEFSFDNQGRAKIKNKNRGKIRLYGCPEGENLLGCELMCPSGEHLGALINFWITEKIKVQDILKYTFYHPTIEEGLKTALLNLAKKLDCKNAVNLFKI